MEGMQRAMCRLNRTPGHLPALKTVGPAPPAARLKLMRPSANGVRRKRPSGRCREGTCAV